MSDLLTGMTITDTGNPMRLSGDFSEENYRQRGKDVQRPCGRECRMAEAVKGMCSWSKKIWEKRGFSRWTSA